MTSQNYTCKYLRMAARHARQGLNLCPLRGEGYLYLAELCFLEGGTSETKSAYIDQAINVRPFHGTGRIAGKHLG